MATTRQKKVAKLIIESIAIDKTPKAGEMLGNVGYSKGVQKSPGRVIESKGVSEELALLGFTPEAAKSVVSKIMNDDGSAPNDRLKAADMTFKVHGTYAPEKNLNINVEVKVDEADLSLAKQILEQRNQRGSPSSRPKSDGTVPQPVGGEVQN